MGFSATGPARLFDQDLRVLLDFREGREDFFRVGNVGLEEMQVVVRILSDVKRLRIEYCPPVNTLLSLVDGETTANHLSASVGVLHEGGV